MRDLHARGLEREDSGFRPFRVRREIHEDVEIVLRDPCRDGELASRRDNFEAVGDAAKALGPFVALLRQRIEEKLEARLVVVGDCLPDHLSHHMIAQVRRQIPNAETAGPALRGARQRLAVDPLRDHVVGLGELQQHLLLDVEVEQQIEKHLKAVGKLELALDPKRLLAQAVEVALDTLIIAEILAHLERLDGKRQRVRAVRLEALEIRDPRVELPRGKQRFAEVLVSEHVRRVGLEHRFIGTNRRIERALLLKQHAEVVVGVDERGLERQCALIGTRRVGERALHLQRDAVVVVRLPVVGSERERALEGGRRLGAVAQRKLREPQRSPQADAVRRAREPLLAQRHGGDRVVRRGRGTGRSDPGIDVAGYCGERGGKIGARSGEIAGIACEDASQVMAGREPGLQFEKARVVRVRGRCVPALMGAHRVVPQRVERGSVQRTVAARVVSRLLRDERRDQRVVIGKRAVDEQGRAGIGSGCKRMDRARRTLREKGRGDGAGQVQQHVEVARGERLRNRSVEGHRQLGHGGRHAARHIDHFSRCPADRRDRDVERVAMQRRDFRERAARRGVDSRPGHEHDDAQPPSGAANRPAQRHRRCIRFHAQRCVARAELGPRAGSIRAIADATLRSVSYSSRRYVRSRATADSDASVPASLPARTAASMTRASRSGCACASRSPAPPSAARSSSRPASSGKRSSTMATDPESAGTSSQSARARGATGLQRRRRRRSLQEPGERRDDRGALVLRCDLQRRIGGTDCACRVAGGEQRLREREIRREMTRVGRGRVAPRCNRVRDPAELPQHFAQVVRCVRRKRIHLLRAAKAQHGVDCAAAPLMASAASEPLPVSRCRRHEKRRFSTLRILAGVRRAKARPANDRRRPCAARRRLDEPSAVGGARSGDESASPDSDQPT